MTDTCSNVVKMASLGSICLVLALAVAGSLGKPASVAATWRDLALNRADGCVVGTTTCADDCASVMLCTAGGYVPFEICQSDEICDATSLTCEPIATGQCTLPQDDVFKCNSVGAFPDPYDCHAHHYCAALPNGTLVNLDYTCEGVTAYDPLTTLCLLSEDDRVCREGPIPACAAAGQTGPQLENPNIYYICVRDPASSRLVPWLFRCPRDTEVFDGVQCVPKESTTTETTTPTTTYGTDTTTDWTTTTTPTTTTPTTTTPTTTTPTTTTPTTTTPTTTTPPTTTPPTTTPTTTTPTTTTPTTTTPSTTTPTTTTPTTTTPPTTTPPTTTLTTTTPTTTTPTTTTPSTTTPTTTTPSTTTATATSTTSTPPFTTVPTSTTSVYQH